MGWRCLSIALIRIESNCISLHYPRIYSKSGGMAAQCSTSHSATATATARFKAVLSCRMACFRLCIVLGSLPQRTMQLVNATTLQFCRPQIGWWVNWTELKSNGQKHQNVSKCVKPWPCNRDVSDHVPYNCRNCRRAYSTVVGSNSCITVDYVEIQLTGNYYRLCPPSSNFVSTTI